MTRVQAAFLILNGVLLAALALALVVRGGYRACYSFLLYVLGVFTSNLVFAVRPDLFVWDYWLASQVLVALLRFVLAAELGWRMFASLPGARGTLAAALLFVSLLTLWAVLAAPIGAPAHTVAQTALARLTHGTAWVFGALLAAKLYYRIPVHPLHQAILRGLVPFLLTFTVALGLLETYGWDVRLPASYGYTLAYDVLLLYWNLVAWKKAAPPDVPSGVLHSLQPWRKI